MTQKEGEISAEHPTIYEELKDPKSQIFQTEKMASLGQMVAGIAHEINNPLAFVSNNVHLCRETFTSLIKLLEAYQSTKQSITDNKRIQYITELEEEIEFAQLKDDIPTLYKAMEDGLERIRKIVLNLKDYSRLDKVDIVQTNLINGLESCLILLNHQIKGRITIIRDYKEIPNVACNPGQINQVFMNILSNAIQAIEEQGSITIQTSTEQQDICIKITDTGEGIPEHIIDRIHEPFFTTKKMGEGTGLGLSISFAIIEKHNGRIIYISEKGKGTTCTIMIPIL